MTSRLWDILLGSSDFSVLDSMQVHFTYYKCSSQGVTDFVDLHDTLKRDFSQVSVQITCFPLSTSTVSGTVLSLFELDLFNPLNSPCNSQCVRWRCWLSRRASDCPVAEPGWQLKRSDSRNTCLSLHCSASYPACFPLTTSHTLLFMNPSWMTAEPGTAPQFL